MYHLKKTTQIKDEKTPFNKDVDGFSARHEDEEREEADTFPQGDPDSFQPHVPQHDEAEATQQTFGMLLGADVAVSWWGAGLRMILTHPLALSMWQEIRSCMILSFLILKRMVHRISN